MSPLSLRVLSTMRLIVGTSCICIPRQVGPLVGVPIVPESMILSRMVGIRDFVLGAYLWKRTSEWERVAAASSASGVGVDAPLLTKDPAATTPEGGLCGGPERPEGETGGGPTLTPIRGQEMENAESALRSALWLGLVCDAVDIASMLVCSLEGNLSDLAKAAIGVGGGVAAAIAAQHLIAMRKRDGRGWMGSVG